MALSLESDMVNEWHGKGTDEKVEFSSELLDALGELAEDSEYWENANAFILKVLGRPVNSLTSRQDYWLENIKASVVVEVDRKEARIAFGVRRKKGQW